MLPAARGAETERKEQAMNAMDILKYGHQTVHETIEVFPEAVWEEAGACGVWSVKDIIAHLASYEEVLGDILSTFIGKHATPYLDRFTEPGGQFNDTEVERRRGRTVREVLDEFNDAYAQVMSLALQIPPEHFRQPGTLPCYGMDYALNHVFFYIHYRHTRE